MNPLPASDIDDPAPDARPTRTAWITLIVILAVGLLLRAGFLVYALQTPGYVWQDPDGYMTQALRLASRDGWEWSFDAVTYSIRGQRHALPPGYSVFLSFFALFPGFPLSAQIAQVLLAVAVIWLVFALGRRMHSAGAGLVAAAGCALWVTNIFNVWSTSQETLYVPLILSAFLLAGRAIDRDASPPVFALVGLAFGVAALTRSMPLFFILPAAALHVLAAANRRRACLQAAALLAGFMVCVVPYTAALSRHFGQLTVIDTHGSIHVEAETGARAPGLLETAAALWAEVAADPGGYVADCLARARSLFHVNGGRILQIYIVAGSHGAALAWKALVHVGADGLLVVSALLAPLGAVLCRGWRLTAWCVLWAGVNIGIASLGGFGGARLRVPFEPMLFVLAGVVCAGSWRRSGWPARFCAMAAIAALTVAFVPQVPRSLQAWPDYGIAWPSVFARDIGRVRTSAGFNIPAPAASAVFSATLEGPAPRQLHVRARGVHVRTLQLTPGQPATVHVPWPGTGMAFLEVDLAGEPDGTVLIAPGGP
jgi:hypothetical protein